jgi:TctA family transporter
VGNVMLLILNIPMIGIWIRILKIPYQHLFPAIMVLLCIGVYSLNNSVFDLYLLLVLGLVGYVIRLLDFEPAPLLIGFVLGPMMEENFRRAMLVARGDPTYFLDRPYALAMLIGAVALLAWSIVSTFRRRGRSVEAALAQELPGAPGP